MPKLPAFSYGSTGNKTISAATKQFDDICGKMAMLGLSVYTPTTDPSYARDLMAQVLHTPNFDVEMEETKEILTETNACHQWWVANLGRLVYPTLDKINGEAAQDFTSDPLHAAIPKFPALPITPSSVSGDLTIASSFTPEHIKRNPMNQMCELGIDNETKNMHMLMQPETIIYMARKVLTMPMRTEEQLLDRHDMALDVLACADASVRNLEVFTCEKFTHEEFRKALMEHGPFHATTLDVNSPAVKAVIELGSSAGVDFSSIAHQDEFQKTCWFVGRLMSEWMLAVRCLMIEASMEVENYYNNDKEEFLKLQAREEQRAKKGGRRRRPQVRSTFSTHISYPSGSYSSYGPSYLYAVPRGTYADQGLYYDVTPSGYPMLEAPPRSGWYENRGYSDGYTSIKYSAASRPNARTYKGPSRAYSRQFPPWF